MQLSEVVSILYEQVLGRRLRVLQDQIIELEDGTTITDKELQDELEDIEKDV